MHPVSDARVEHSQLSEPFLFISKHDLDSPVRSSAFCIPLMRSSRLPLLAAHLRFSVCRFLLHRSLPSRWITLLWALLSKAASRKLALQSRYVERTALLS